MNQHSFPFSPSQGRIQHPSPSNWTPRPVCVPNVPAATQVATPVASLMPNPSPISSRKVDDALPYPDAMTPSTRLTTYRPFFPSSILHPSMLQDSSTFHRIAQTTFSPLSTSPFLFSARNEATSGRKRKSVENGGGSAKKSCVEEKMARHMSRLSLSQGSTQNDLEDDVEGEDEEFSSEPVEMRLAPELQINGGRRSRRKKVALNRSEILPNELLAKLPGPSKSGMELVLWRPPGNVVPKEIMVSLHENDVTKDDSSVVYVAATKEATKDQPSIGDAPPLSQPSSRISRLPPFRTSNGANNNNNNLNDLEMEI